MFLQLQLGLGHSRLFYEFPFFLLGIFFLNLIFKSSSWELNANAQCLTALEISFLMRAACFGGHLLEHQGKQWNVGAFIRRLETGDKEAELPLPRLGEMDAVYGSRVRLSALTGPDPVDGHRGVGSLSPGTQHESSQG